MLPNRTEITSSGIKKPSPGKIRARIGLGGSDVGGLLKRIHLRVKELKQDIGSRTSQCRNAQAVNNHLQFCMMASTISWLYANLLKADPECRHKAKAEPVLPFRMFGGLSPRQHSMMNLIGFAPNQAIPRKILWWPCCCAWWPDEFLGNFSLPNPGKNISSTQSIILTLCGLSKLRACND